MLPGCSVFLDVDDLQAGRGAEYVDLSAVVIILISKGYFGSPYINDCDLDAAFDILSHLHQPRTLRPAPNATSWDTSRLVSFSQAEFTGPGPNSS